MSGHALRWAVRCYRDNAALLIALATAASLQRFVAIRYGRPDQLAGRFPRSP